MNSDPLSALKPLHLPEPIGWWPPAPGWWALAILGTGLLVLATRALWRRWRAGRYRRAALRALRAALRALRAARRGTGTEPNAFAATAANILRRAALARFGPERVAALSGTAWLEFLDRSGRMQGFATGPGQALAHAPYDPSAGCDTDALAELCRLWLRRHR